MSWVRAETDGIERARVALRAAGVELPRDMAILDLRMWQDRVLAPSSRVAMPSLAILADRWGWTKKRARLLLSDEQEWSDPSRLEDWSARGAKRKGHDEGTTRARRGHDEGTIAPEATPTITESGHDEGTTRARRGHDEGHRRVGSPYPTLPYGSDQRESARATPDPAPAPRGTLDEKLVHAAALEAMRATLDPAPIRLDSEHKRRLTAAYRQRGLTAEGASALWAYVALSDEDEPLFLRSKGHTGWSTLLNDNLPSRLEKALAWERRGRVDELARGPPRRVDQPTMLSRIAALPD